MKERITAGPAKLAAVWPLSTKMPVPVRENRIIISQRLEFRSPMILPTPNMSSWKGPNVRFKELSLFASSWSWVTVFVLINRRRKMLKWETTGFVDRWPSKLVMALTMNFFRVILMKFEQESLGKGSTIDDLKDGRSWTKRNVIYVCVSRTLSYRRTTSEREEERERERKEWINRIHACLESIDRSTVGLDRYSNSVCSLRWLTTTVTKVNVGDSRNRMKTVLKWSIYVSSLPFIRPWFIFFIAP